MNDRQREIVEAAAERLHMARKGLTRAELHDELYQLALDVLVPPARADGEELAQRRSPAAGEVLPPHQRATWARGRSIYDAA